jgi:hypothetical protein
MVWLDQTLLLPRWSVNPTCVYLGEWSAEDHALMIELDHRWVMKHAPNWRTFQDPAIRSRLQRAHIKMLEIIQERIVAAEERAKLARKRAFARVGA